VIAENPFFLLWIAAVVVSGWLFPQRWLPAVLASSCGIFLFIYSPWSLVTLAGITLIVGLTIIHGNGHRTVLLGAIAASCLILVAYRAIFQHQGIADQALLLGFAFYILRAIHILLDDYMGRLNRPGWIELVSWLWFLPTLQVGPIHRFQPFQRELQRRRWDSTLFAQGLLRIMWGFFKIIVLANYLVDVKFVYWLNSLDQQGWWFNYLDTLRYGMNLYFKFAGYSDIAIGFSLLLGFRVMENFNFPFLARDISDFWRRWHISLSSWCRDYVYLPVFSITRVPAIAAVATMLVLGLWHELSWRYLLWGLWHGIGIAVCQQWQRSHAAVQVNSGISGKIWAPIALFITLNFVILSFVITSADSIPEMMQRWRTLLSL